MWRYCRQKLVNRNRTEVTHCKCNCTEERTTSWYSTGKPTDSPSGHPPNVSRGACGQSVAPFRVVLDRPGRSRGWRWPNQRFLRHDVRWRFNFCPAWHRKVYGSGKLWWSRMLFQKHNIWRNYEANEIIGGIVYRMPSVDQSKRRTVRISPI